MEYLGDVIGTEQGYTMYFLHTSYNCPVLKLYGYRNDLQLRRAIKQAVRKMNKEHEDRYQPKTGVKCSCKKGIERDNCPQCEGTGMQIDFAKIRAANSLYHAKE